MAAFLLLLPASLSPTPAAERTESFDKDPHWDGVNNRATTEKRTIRQDFGFSKTNHAGGKIGEIGGFITPTAEPAYYAKKIDTKSFDDPLSASGRLLCQGRQFHVLVGFFNADTINEWRTPNSIAIRLLGAGMSISRMSSIAPAAGAPAGIAPADSPRSRTREVERI